MVTWELQLGEGEGSSGETWFTRGLTGGRLVMSRVDGRDVGTGSFEVSRWMTCGASLFGMLLLGIVAQAFLPLETTARGHF